MAWLKAVLAWAVGAGLLDRNPLLGYAPSAEASPRRPIVTASQYEELLAASHRIHSLFRLTLIVVHETGHRIGAVRLLRWADIDLEHQLVRWRAENDKIGYEHETWLTYYSGRGSPGHTAIASRNWRVGVPGTVGPGEADFPPCGSELVGER